MTGVRAGVLKAQAALAAVVFSIGVGAVIAGGGSSGATLAAPEVLRLVRNAPAALSTYPALRINGTFTVSFSGRTVHETLLAITTPDGRTGIATITLPSIGTHLTTIVAGGKLYAQLPNSGGHWGACQASSSGIGGLNAGAATAGSDPLAYLRLMPGAAGGVTAKGHATIEGAQTTEYQVSIDLTQVLQQLQQQGSNPAAVTVDQLRQLGLTRMPYDVWIDEQKQIRQFAFQLRAQGFNFKARLRIAGASTAPTVTEPAVSDVTNFPTCQDLSYAAAK